MEPVRGGKLANLPDFATERLSKFRPGASAASFAFRWLTSIPEVGVILSGMSNIEQLEDNLKTFDGEDPITEEESAYLLDLAEGMKKSVPCTACRYCVDGCPMGLDIPMFMATYNELSYQKAVNSAIHIQSLPADKQPNACITCQRCVRSCPQNIDIPLTIKKLIDILAEVPNWDAICRQREEEAKKLKENK
jgi:predicted aldo/keto reductase-like oxidoreductase